MGLNINIKYYIIFLNINIIFKYKYVMKYYYKHTRYGNLIYCKKKTNKQKNETFP